MPPRCPFLVVADIPVSPHDWDSTRYMKAAGAWKGKRSRHRDGSLTTLLAELGDEMERDVRAVVR